MDLPTDLDNVGVHETYLKKRRREYQKDRERFRESQLLVALHSVMISNVFVVKTSCVWVPWCAHTPKKITVVICVVLYPDFTIIIIPFIILGLIVLGEGAEDTSPGNRSKSLVY